MLQPMAERAPLSRLVVGLAAAAAAAQGLAALFRLPTLGRAALIDAFLASALLGAGLIAAVALPPRWKAWAVGAGILMEALIFAGFPPPDDLAQSVVQRGAGLGLVLLAALALHAGRATAEARRAAQSALNLALVLPLFVVASGPALELTALLHPATLDAPCLRADALLGQPSFAAGMLFGHHPPLGQACAVIYGELPLFCALVIVPSVAGDRPRAAEIVTAFVALGVAGYILYHVFPVAGPRYAAPGWPGRVPLEALAQPPPVPRNCMPSMHTAWVLYCAFQLRRGWRPLGVVWVLGTLLATLGLGLHYAVDLIAALPVAAGVPWLMRRLRRGG
jgi:hypothetical protein